MRSGGVAMPLRMEFPEFNCNLDERCINKLKQSRHIATRYDRKASAYLAFAKNRRCAIVASLL